METEFPPTPRQWQRRALVAILFAILAGGIGVGAATVYRNQQRAALERATYAPPPEGMVFVPAGDAIIGTDDPDAPHDERPRRAVFVKAFYIDTTEVTNAAYQRVVPSHTFDKGRENYPVTGVTREQAAAYARAVGKRLPTAVEWEKAARGDKGNLFPWGDHFDTTCANLGGKDGLQPVGSYAKGASPYGALDMSGNAWEWVQDDYRDSDRLGGGGVDRAIIRGGGYSYSTFQGRASYNGFENAATTCHDLGFRCAKDAPPVE